MINKDKVGALFFLVLSLFYGLMIFNIPLNIMAKEAAFTARTVPVALAVGGISISLLILFLPSADAGGRDSIIKTFSGFNWKRAGLLLGLMIFYGLILKLAGFIISSIIFLFVGFRILGEQRVKILLLASIPFVVVFWFLLNKILGVYLAPGSIFFFLGGK
jgi:putative tricarboxylic transport membrane protein